MKRHLAVVAIVVAASPSWAQGFFQDPAVYGGLGYAKTSLDDDGLFRGWDKDDDDRGMHLFGGYRFNRYLAAELSVRDLGDYRAQGQDFHYRSELVAATVGVVGTLPLGEKVSLYARLGAGYVTMDERLTSSSYRYKDDDSGGVSSLGAGVEFRPLGRDGLALRLGWESHFFTIETDRLVRVGSTVWWVEDDYDQRVDSFGLDLSYYFSL